MDFDDLILPVAGILTIALLAVIIWAAIKDSKEWDAYKIEHHCRVSGHISSSVGNGFGTDSRGNATVTTIVTPGKTIYTCDNNDTEIR